MSNTIGTLFSSIANSIRDGLGDIGTMKPAEFPAKIDEIVELIGTGGGSGGEKNVVAVSKTFDATETIHTVTHDLGVVPDIVIVHMANTTSNAGIIIGAIGYCEALYNALDEGKRSKTYMCTSDGSFSIGADCSIENTSTDSEKYGHIRNATATTFTVGGTTGKLDVGSRYYYTLISGLRSGSTSGSTSGSSADVRYVTFMDHTGTVELGKKAVAVGDNCADPIARGVFDTPTRESTVQYDYTFVGWTSSANGAWDENVLNEITANKTVYAAYGSVLRYYTVTYYDDDGSTVLKTESLAYGAMPSYTPVKVGYTFNGWTTEFTTVTGSASYTAQWIAKADFNALTWAQIAEYAESGNADKVFDLGATKTFTMTQYDSGTTIPNTTVTAQIVGFNHDDLADGSGKAGITLRLLDMNYARISWQGGATTAHYQRMWDESSIRTSLNGIPTYSTYSFPADLYAVMKSVTKIFYDAMDGAYNTCEDKLFLPSCSELGFHIKEEGDCYALFTDGKVAGTEYSDVIVDSRDWGGAAEYWTRTKTGTSYIHVYSVSRTGVFSQSINQNSGGAYAFAYICI